MAIDEEKRRKGQDAAKASAAPSAAAQAAKMSVANEAARLAAKRVPQSTQNKSLLQQSGGLWRDVKGGFSTLGRGFAGVNTAFGVDRGQQSAGMFDRLPTAGRISDGVKPGGVNPVGSHMNDPNTGAPLGLDKNPTGNKKEDQRPGPYGGQSKQTPEPRNYLEIANYGNNPLMNPSLIDAMTRPATEEAKQRFREMGGIQTIRGTMDPDKRISAGWWNPNTLREHATIQEGMMGVDYPVAEQRYAVDAPLQAATQQAGIKAGADIARERIGLEKPVPVKMVDPMGNESEVLAYPDRTKIGSGEAGGPDPAKVVEDMAAANSREEAQAILEGQPPAVQEQVRKLWGIVRSLGERQ